MIFIKENRESGNKVATILARQCFRFSYKWGDDMAGRKSKSGRRDKYESYVKPHLKEISQWVQTMDEEQIARRLGVGVSTWHAYKNQHPELLDAIKAGRQDLISDIKSALKMRAKGFEYTETKTYTKVGDNGSAVYEETTTKYAPPDVAACNSILQNIDPEWRRDRALYDLKKKEFELKRKLAEANNWLNNEEDDNA